MKKFYVSPIFPLILGIVAFGVLSVQLVFVTNTLVTLFLLLLILGSYSLLFIHQRDYYSKSEVEQIQYVNHQAEDSLTTLLEQMPVGVIKLDLSSGEVEWFNPYAELILTNEVGEIDVALIQISRLLWGIQVLMPPWVRLAIRFIWTRYLEFFISLMCLENTKRLLS